MCLYIVRAPPPGADWLIRRLTSACMRTRKACALSKPRCRLLRLRPSDLTAPAAGRAPFGPPPRVCPRPAPARALLTRFCTFVSFKVPRVSDTVRCLSVSVQLVSRGVTPPCSPEVLQTAGLPPFSCTRPVPWWALAPGGPVGERHPRRPALGSPAQPPWTCARGCCPRLLLRGQCVSLLPPPSLPPRFPAVLSPPGRPPPVRSRGKPRG